MSDISMLTMLIQAAACIKNKIGDPSIQGYVEGQGMSSRRRLEPSREVDFTTLDCICNILVQNSQIVAASYDDATRFTLVTSELDHTDLDDHDESQNLISIDMGFPPEESILSINTFMPINAAVIPNANDRKAKDANDRNESCQLSGPLGQIRNIETGKNLWTLDDPLGDVAE